MYSKISPKEVNAVVCLVQAIFNEFKSEDDTGQLVRRKILVWKERPKGDWTAEGKMISVKRKLFSVTGISLCRSGVVVTIKV